MKCTKCNKRAVFLKPKLCKAHFIAYFENKIKSTIVKFSLINKNDKIIVATSGGKDSLSCLLALSKLYPGVEGLLIDEGISEYRNYTIKDLQLFCKSRNIKYRVVSFKKEFGFSLDYAVKKTGENPCTLCGILRRYLLNKSSAGFDVIATGHNMDDEAQAIIMNLLRYNINLLARLGPKTGKTNSEMFVQRIKPMYFITEKESMAYSYLNNLKTKYVECPYVQSSYRAKVRDFLNESSIKDINRNIILSFLKIQKKIKPNSNDGMLRKCEKCGQPSQNQICNACCFLKKIK
ncbi:MAG: TIGR00269 family protein [archaeon]